MRLLGRGLAEREIAHRLGIGIGTVWSYRDEIKRRLRAVSRGDVRVFAKQWSAGKVWIRTVTKRERH